MLLDQKAPPPFQIPKPRHPHLSIHFQIYFQSRPSIPTQTFCFELKRSLKSNTHREEEQKNSDALSSKTKIHRERERESEIFTQIEIQ